MVISIHQTSTKIHQSSTNFVLLEFSYNDDKCDVLQRIPRHRYSGEHRTSQLHNPIIILIVVLFRKTKLNSMSATSKKKPDTNQPHLNRRRKIRRRKRGPWAAVALPHFRVTATWALYLLTSLASAVLLVLYSFEFGAETANRWMVAVVLSCIQDVLLFQPGWILFKKIACSCFQGRRPLAQDDDSREISASSPDPADARAHPMPRKPEESVQRQRKIRDWNMKCTLS